MEKAKEMKETKELNPEGAENSEAKVKTLEELLAEKEKALAEANAAIAEMKRSQVSLEGEITVLKEKSTALEENLERTNESLKGAVASYRTLLVQSSPGVLGELVGGESVDSVNDSLEKAKALLSKVRQGLETEIEANRIPLGAPARSSPNFSGLSPREKISYAIGRT